MSEKPIEPNQEEIDTIKKELIVGLKVILFTVLVYSVFALIFTLMR